MQLITKKLPKNHKLFLAGDLHEGTILQHKHGIKQLISEVKKEKNGYLIIMGDLCEAITLDDKRYSRSTEDPETPLPLLQYQNLAKQFMSIKDKILLVLEGNHDWKIAAKFGNCVKDIFCKDLGVDYGTSCSKLTVKDDKNKLQYKAFLTHYIKNVGSTADDPIRRDANMQLQLKQRLKRKCSDAVLQCAAHTHKLIVASPAKDLYLIDNDGKIKQNYTQSLQTLEYIHPDLRWYVNTGSFLKLFAMGVSGYAERAGYDPTELGYVVVNVSNGIITGIDKKILD